MSARSTTSTAVATAASPTKPGNRYAIAVLGKALDLIDVLDGEEGLTLTALSLRTGINKATALRILANLEERAYVERDGDGRYRLGVRLLQLGSRMSAGLDLRTTARPVLKRLLAEFDETVNLAVPSPSGIVYIDILESARGLRMAATVGLRDDFHSTAVGKAILAQWPEEQVTRALGDGPLVAKTRRTIVAPAALRRELAAVRQRGYALDDEENESGARCVGAPLFDHRGDCVGAISVSGPASRLADGGIAALAPRVVAASREISASLGYRETGRQDGGTAERRDGGKERTG